MNQHQFHKNSNSHEYRSQSTRFNLDALQANDPQEIKNVASKYDKLNQKQKDLIRHQAPDAFSAVNKIIKQAYASSQKAHEHTNQAHDRNSERTSSEREKTFHSGKSRDEKRDSYEHADRQHERDTNAQNSRHDKTQNTTLEISKIATVGAVAIAAIITAAKIFGGGKK